MDISNIIEKAKILGLDIGNGQNSPETLQLIANQVGLNDFNTSMDLDKLEDALNDRLGDNQLGSKTAEDYLDENYEESYDNSYNQSKFGEREYKNAKDENGHHDKDYYKKRGQELDEKVSKAQEEKDRDWKKKNPNDEEPVKADGSNTENKNRRDKLKDNINLERAKYDRWKNKLDGIKAKTYQTMHPVEAAKEEAKEKLKDEGKKVGKTAAKGAAKVAKATGRLVAAGGKAVIGFLASNPIVLAIIACVVILFIIIFMLFSKPPEENLDTMGYFDTTCDFNLTTVVYSCSPYEDNPKEMGLKEFTLGVAYSESEKQKFSEAAIKALMIIVRTNALAEGNYDSGGDKIVNVNNCSYSFTDVYEDLEDEEENEKKQDKVKLLEQYYNEINNFLFISNSYKSEITDLGKEDALEYNDDIIEKLVEINSNGYEEILQEIYAVDEDEKEEVITVEDDKPYLFIGDSRTVQMKGAVSELTDNNTVAKGSMGYSWFESTAIPSANGILSQSDKAYNIVSWMGVNDAATRSTVNSYINKYKELAEGQWSKHTIYIVSIGPVGSKYSYTSQYGTITSKEFNEDIDYFNDTMEKAINDANLSNLKFIRLNYNITAYQVNDTQELHYSNEDSKTIFSDIISKIYKNKTISKTKSLFNNSEYCTYYRYNNGCEAGWWYPIGESGDFSKGAILRGDPELVDTGVDNFGWRIDPFDGQLKYHNASDLWAPNIGMNVIATRSGTVTIAVDGYIDNPGENNGEGCGNYVKIDHGDGFSSMYCHLKQGSVTKYVSVGMSVSQGQIIGLSGNSGRTTGPHLHFGIYENSSDRNPFNYISTDNPRPKSNCKNYDADVSGVCHALKDLGFSDNAVAGLMANIVSEGGVDPTTVVPNDGGSGPSYGMIGWHDQFACSSVDVCEVGTKLPGVTCNGSKLKCYCRQNNMEWDTVACQTAYIKQYIDDHANTPGFDAAKEVYGDYSAYEIAKQFSFKLERCQRCSVGTGANRVPGPACYERGSKADEFLPFVKNGCKN